MHHVRGYTRTQSYAALSKWGNSGVVASEIINMWVWSEREVIRRYCISACTVVLSLTTHDQFCTSVWSFDVRLFGSLITINTSCKLHGVLLAYKLLHTTIQVIKHTNSLKQVYTAVWTGSCLTNGSRTCTYILLTLFMAFGPWCSLDKKYWWQCGVNGTISLNHVSVKLMNISYWHTIT